MFVSLDVVDAIAFRTAVRVRQSRRGTFERRVTLITLLAECQKVYNESVFHMLII
jgi:hypothetical protein